MAQDASLKDILGDKFLGKSGKDLVEVTFEDRIANMDAVGVYFSAHWCPPCRMFTPKLKEAYEAWKKQGDKVELIFVSSDQDENAMKGYFGEMGDWLVVAWNGPQSQSLKQRFNVQGIPFFVVLDKNGKTVDGQGRATVTNKGAKATAEWIK